MTGLENPPEEMALARTDTEGPSNHMDSKVQNKPATELEVFIRQKRLLAEGFFPGSHASLWRAVQSGAFPKPIKLSAGMTAWRQSDVRAWQEKQGATS
jgi:prophage regulatory protein